MHYQRKQNYEIMDDCAVHIYLSWIYKTSILAYDFNSNIYSLI